MLVSYLREHGVTAEQSDLNIALTHGLIQPPALRARLRVGGLDEFDTTLLEFAVEQHDLLWRTVVGKEPTALPYDVGFRLVNNLMDVMLRGSALVRKLSTLSDALATDEELAGDVGDVGDVAATWHDRLAADMLDKHRTRVLGISVAFPSQLIPAFRLARMVKRRAPDTIVVLGGQQIMLRDVALAALPGTFRQVDAIATGRGEPVLRALGNGVPVEEVAGLITARGVSGPAPEPHHLAQNPAPVFDGLPFMSYLSPAPQLPLISCVGCYWGRCTFCSYGNRSRGGAYQQLTQHQLAAHVEAALERTGAGFVAFVDENCNLRLILGAVELVRARGNDFTWSTRNRLEPLLTDRRFVQRMHAAGCRLMSVGYETNSQRLLDIIDKGVRADQYERIVEVLDEVGIVLRLSVMGGLPDETEQEARDSREFLARNAHRLGIDAAQMMIAEPATLLVEHAEHQHGVTVGDGAILQSNDGFSYLAGRHGHVVDYAGASREERAAWLRETVRTVLPGKNYERHPRWKQSSPNASATGLVLHPWVVHSDGTLLDLRWRMHYRMAREHVTCEPPRLVARSAVGRRLLGLLEEAGIGSS
ncbi:B12-binding domain-containing radical SAM protein [Amycolatopsis nigrescens]|uniref:B12-binding domain-containing radical SAM protein n=1 Tax=Amycolatopsis nigrescens TaxID=381445 RepID=UPI00035C798C|nr:B12-binding domain-containing radical SAM protein [Amycolatopsis nigrescens]